MKPILFLDIDGVLNSVQWFIKQKGITKRLDTKCVRLLQSIVTATNCDIVIMSTWRLFHTRLQIMQALCDAGYVPPVPIIGETPNLKDPGRIRGHEVDAWLLDTYGAQSYVRGPDEIVYCCVDDDTDFCRWHPLVRTNNNDGLTKADAEKIIEKLSRPL